MNKLLILFIAFLFLGCEEIIEVDINSSDPQIIIEAKLSNSIVNNFVKITRSTDFYNPNEYIKISDAEITITDGEGNSYPLQEILPGRYQSVELVSVPQKRYSIEVNHQSDKYVATSYAPPTIFIDSLSYKLEPRPFRDKKFLELHVHFQDEENQADYARFVVYKNKKQIERIFLYDDRLTNGNEIDFFFFNFDEDEEFLPGDEILVELQTIDKEAHTYFRTLRRALARSTGGPFGPAAPANPTTNWDKNALGYFSAFTFDSKSIVIQ